MDNGHVTITILGREWPVQLPDFATREDLFAVLAESQQDVRRLRVYCATLGLCTSLGGEARAPAVAGQSRRLPITLRGHGYDLYAYGGAVRGWLHEQGASPRDIADAAIPLIGVLAADLFPREGDVKEAATFSNPPAAPQT